MNTQADTEADVLEDFELDTKPYRVPDGKPFDLADRATRDDGGFEKEDAKACFHALRRRLVDLQENLYAESKRSLLVVFQAMDAGGKDSTTKAVFGPVDPAGCRVKSFKAPTSEELGHDFLWRVHQNVPKKGYIGVFNRSHYEDAVTVAVKKLAPKDVWKHRVDHINHFEHLLHTEGTRVVKFFLHISKDYQKERLQRRLDRPDKHWKFNPADLDERARWEKYQDRYAEVFAQTSPKDAPWYVIPAERRWYRNLLVCKVLVDLLEKMDPQPPEPDFDPASIVIE
ncbi:polyphosphate kinase 2 family protein [Phycisphaeraceae bacterium D3-23]